MADGTGLCPGHDRRFEESWAAVNRIMCDFLHRGIVTPRLAAMERAEGLSAHAAEMA